MPIQFKINERLAGYVEKGANKGELTRVCYKELIGPQEAFHLQKQLELLEQTLFSKIPGLPARATIKNLLVVIKKDLSCTAYVNELKIRDEVEINKDAKRGDIVFLKDIEDITSVHLGVDIPSNCGVVFMRSFDWRRSVLFDYGPLIPDVGDREYAIDIALGKQMLLLLGIDKSENNENIQSRLQKMDSAILKLKNMLQTQNQKESEYQELLLKNPWMLGGSYSDVSRHFKLDNKRIPDFTAMRCYDNCNDIIEIKQPFLNLFQKNGNFSAEFNNSWNQAEEYLSFVSRQRSYLIEEKSLKFENPKCILLLGNDLNDGQIKKIRDKESISRTISIITYDHLLKIANHVYSLMSSMNRGVTHI